MSEPVVLQNSTLSQYRLSNELWLRIFNNLDRNDIDSCDSVCKLWNKIIRTNQRYLPLRHINYIIISSKRVFSITACSGSVIRCFRFNKYFDYGDMHLNLNDHCNRMSSETIRLSPTTERFFAPTFVNEVLYPTLEPNPAPANSLADPALNEGSDTARIVGFGLPMSIKTKWKLETPPKLFFIKLNSLLQNCEQIDDFCFYFFTLTTSFVEKYLLHVYPTPRLENFRVQRLKTDGIKSMYFDYLKGVLLNATSYKPF